jgi:hypothetical protein
VVVVGLFARTVVVGITEVVGAAVVTAPAAGTLCAVVVEVDGRAGLLADEHDVAAAASATAAASSRRLDNQVITAEFPRAARWRGSGPEEGVPGARAPAAGSRGEPGWAWPARVC